MDKSNIRDEIVQYIKDNGDVSFKELKKRFNIRCSALEEYLCQITYICYLYEYKAENGFRMFGII